jgi:hypothetical protein
VLKLATFGQSEAAGGWVSEDKYPRHLADVNGDGMADIVGFGGAGVIVSLATGGGNFASPVLKLAAFGQSEAGGGWISDDKYPRHLADVNGDGLADIVGFGDSGVQIAYASGGGSFFSGVPDIHEFGPSTSGWISQDKYPRYLADVNHDGAADIVAFGGAGALVSLAHGFLFGG